MLSFSDMIERAVTYKNIMSAHKAEHYNFHKYEPIDVSHCNIVSFSCQTDRACDFDYSFYDVNRTLDEIHEYESQIAPVDFFVYFVEVSINEKVTEWRYIRYSDEIVAKFGIKDKFIKTDGNQLVEMIYKELFKLATAAIPA